jgi:hypothetical protein
MQAGQLLVLSRPHRSMSLRPAIPRRVALLHCSPPLHQPFVIVNRVAGTLNRHLTGTGEFSTGTLGDFQPELTKNRSEENVFRLPGNRLPEMVDILTSVDQEQDKFAEQLPTDFKRLLETGEQIPF